MTARWRQDELPKIMAKLASRPGHESVRTLIAGLLRQGAHASLSLRLMI